MLFAGCSRSELCDHPEHNPTEFELVENRLSYNFSSDEDIAFIQVETSLPEADWYLVQPEADWCRVAKSYDNVKGIYLAVDENEDVDFRQTTFRVVAGTYVEYELSVRQLGYGPAIIVESKVIDNHGGAFTVEVTSNINIRSNKPQLDADDEESWLELANDGEPVAREESHGLTSATYEMYALFNSFPYSRKGRVLFTATDPMFMTDEVTGVCTVTQLTGSVSGQISTYADKMATIESGTLSQPSYTNCGIEKLYDGDTTSQSEPNIYHSAYGSAGETTFPIEMTFKFASPSAVSYFKYYTRNGNGNPGTFDAQYRLAGESEFTNVKEGQYGPSNSMYDFGQQGGIQICQFPETISNIEEVKLIFYSGLGGFLSGAEIEFYENATTAHNDELLEIFTDLSCSELKSGVTRKDITELHKNFPYLAQEVAIPLLEGTYPASEKDFRIGTYQAYSNNETIYKDMHTRKYSAFDNPTGIYVSSGSKIYVCVDAIPEGQTILLGIANDEGTNYCKYDSFNSLTPLFEGLNEITATTNGMCYIVNRADVLTSASQPVKAHFLPGSGIVEGYFDIARHTDADYERLLNSTTRKYFIAKGQNIIFLMHTTVLRANVPRGIISGLSSWDDILGWQLELMGLAKESNGVWDRMIDQTHFNNHMVAISNTDPSSYMDASDYRINFNATTGIPKIITRDLLLAAEDNTWGPAHEAGHVNQRAILWKSNAESSNNLFSNFAIYRFGKYGSRGSKISDLAASFADHEHKAWVLMGSSTHMNEDTEVHMRMNWQLWNYFHRCGVDPEFWPRLFELMRTKYILPNENASLYGLREDNGQCQLIFAEAVCEAAKMDFTDFFEVWGFWEPVDITYTQYGTARYNVSQQMINETLQSIASKGYPKAPAIQYIEDRDVKGGVRYSELGYYTTFRDKKSVSGTPSYTVDGRNIKVENCTDGVAIEIRGVSSGSELGELRYFSNMTNFEVPASVSLTNVKVYVVQWDSKRIEATRK